MNVIHSRRMPNALMGDGSDEDGRPAKRIRLGRPDDTSQQQDTTVTDIPGLDFTAPTDDLSYGWSMGLSPPVFDADWRWATSATSLPMADSLLAMESLQSNDVWPTDETAVPCLLDERSMSGPAITQYEILPSSATIEPSSISLSSISSAPIISKAPCVPPPTLRSTVPPVEIQQYDDRSRPQSLAAVLQSPFKDCIETFGTFNSPKFQRPSDGQINGYVKFNWVRKESEPSNRVVELPDDEDSPKSSKSASPPTTQSLAYNAGLDSPVSTTSTILSPHSAAATLRQSPVSTTTSISLKRRASTAGFYPNSSVRLNVSSRSTGSSPTTFEVTVGATPGSTPSFIPPHFGHDAAMDTMDRGLWRFYINNWCPGRSVLDKTNLWLTDFPKLQGKSGVLAAIQSLAGIYVYDYQPNEVIRSRVNERFSHAESRLSSLLNSEVKLDSEQVIELVTISSLLSMQDIVLVERRLKRPHDPRWLQGFKQAEQFLQATDPGLRFWDTKNVQLDSLRISQSVIVGRAVILAQPMMMLPDPETMDPKAESARFGWLLYGTKEDMYEIHGGCGFSKRLLHILSQVTYCAARLQQAPKSLVVPTTARFLEEELERMRQWSREGTNGDLVQDLEHQPISWIRETSDDFQVSSAPQMTETTAEAWRLAAVLYLQCRLLRLPRDHPDVVLRVGELAKCIAIMPTSGSNFTAQAPLFPVFLLGLLSTVPSHKSVAIDWFQSVVRTPVRSSVPPLYDALKRILSWLGPDADMLPGTELPEAIGDRTAWWENLVLKVQETEEEVLCLT